jgi:hypothetical protein
MRNVYRMSLFIALLPMIYLATAFLFSNVYCNGYSVMGLATGQLFTPGGWGQSLRRFRQINGFGSVDLLFLGSSHAYRGFDPRVFSREGYRSFNMGSSSQTPLNSYFLLKQYFPQLKPKLVVLEVYPVLLSKDGLESYLDLAGNVPASQEMFQMAVATRNLGAVNGMVRTTFEQQRTPLALIEQQHIDDERYIDGGYCETTLQKYDGRMGKVHQVEIAEKQMKYLRLIIAFLKQNNSDTLLVSQPLPKEHIKRIKNYRYISETLSDLAKSQGVTYIDYNSRLQFDSYSDFYDNDHLTSRGVAKFNSVVLQDIRTMYGARLAAPH